MKKLELRKEQEKEVKVFEIKIKHNQKPIKKT